MRVKREAPFLLRTAGIALLSFGVGKMIADNGLWSLPVISVLVGTVMAITGVLWYERRGF
jgi:hypothetical protein